MYMYYGKLGLHVYGIEMHPQQIGGGGGGGGWEKIKKN